MTPVLEKGETSESLKLTGPSLLRISELQDQRETVYKHKVNGNGGRHHVNSSLHTHAHTHMNMHVYQSPPNKKRGRRKEERKENGVGMWSNCLGTCGACTLLCGVAHICNPSTGERKQEDQKIQGHPRLCGEFKANLCCTCVRPCLKIN